MNKTFIILILSCVVRFSFAQNEEIKLTLLLGVLKQYSFKFKQTAEMEDNIVKSYVFKGSNTIDYIALPGFYSDFDPINALGCSSDVAKELYKLKKENVEEIILDLRHIVGRSLKEVIDLSGIFIDLGPILVGKQFNQKSKTLNGMNRGAACSGPLMIIINSDNSSASEVVAGALQDYSRALIVEQASHGKATEQIVLPIDTTAFYGKAKYGKKMGYAKITIGTLHRIRGESNQINSVVPDVLLPFLPKKITHREANYPNAIANEKLMRKKYYQEFPSLPNEILQSQNQKRIDTCNDYTGFIKHITAFEKVCQEEKNKIPLNPIPFILRVLKLNQLKDVITISLDLTSYA